jgi:hypothetical protein
MRQVDVYVDQPSCIELHVRETVRIDRLYPTETAEYIAEQHGALLAPGANQLQLEAGIYHFRTLDDAQLRVISGGVRVDSMSARDKDIWPDPKAKDTDGATASAVRAAVEPRGHGPCGRVPALSIEDKANVAS